MEQKKNDRMAQILKLKERLVTLLCTVGVSAEEKAMVMRGYEFKEDMSSPSESNSLTSDDLSLQSIESLNRDVLSWESNVENLKNEIISIKERIQFLWYILCIDHLTLGNKELNQFIMQPALFIPDEKLIAECLSSPSPSLLLSPSSASLSPPTPASLCNGDTSHSTVDHLPDEQKYSFPPESQNAGLNKIVKRERDAESPNLRISITILKREYQRLESVALKTRFSVGKIIPRLVNLWNELEIPDVEVSALWYRLVSSPLDSPIPIPLGLKGIQRETLVSRVSTILFSLPWKQEHPYSPSPSSFSRAENGDSSSRDPVEKYSKVISYEEAQIFKFPEEADAWCNEELSRLMLLKEIKLKELIKSQMKDISHLWDLLNFSDAQKSKFIKHLTCVYNAESDGSMEEIHALIQKEKLRLLDLLESMKSIMDMILRREWIKKEMKSFEQYASDPCRLSGSSTRLLQEEKFRKVVSKEYPKLTAKIRKRLESWNKEHGQELLYNGKSYIDLMSQEKEDPKSELLHLRLLTESPSPRKHTIHQSTSPSKPSLVSPPSPSSPSSYSARLKNIVKGEGSKLVSK